jgi:hypothetical protein
MVFHCKLGSRSGPGVCFGASAGRLLVSSDPALRGVAAGDVSAETPGGCRLQLGTEWLQESLFVQARVSYQLEC